MCLVSIYLRRAVWLEGSRANESRMPGAAVTLGTLHAEVKDAVEVTKWLVLIGTNLEWIPGAREGTQVHPSSSRLSIETAASQYVCHMQKHPVCGSALLVFVTACGLGSMATLQ
jgi:hypothetical protein